MSTSRQLYCAALMLIGKGPDQEAAPECRHVPGIPAFAGGSWTLAGDLAVERARAWSTAIPWFSIRSL